MNAKDRYIAAQKNTTSKIIVDSEIQRHKSLAQTDPAGAIEYLKKAMQILRTDLSTTFLFKTWTNYNFGDMFSDPNVFLWIDHVVELEAQELYNDFFKATNDAELSRKRAYERAMGLLDSMFDRFFVDYNIHCALDLELNKLITGNKKKKSFTNKELEIIYGKLVEAHYIKGYYGDFIDMYNGEEGKVKQLVWTMKNKKSKTVAFSALVELLILLGFSKPQIEIAFELNFGLPFDRGYMRSKKSTNYEILVKIVSGK